MKQFKNQLDTAILTKTRQLAYLTALMRKELPPETHEHYHVASIREKTLYIVTDSPVWTTRLRQLAPQILQITQIRSQCQHVHISSRLQPAANVPKPATVMRQLSEKSSQLIRQTSSYIEDENLKKALLKMSRHGSEHSDPE